MVYTGRGALNWLPDVGRWGEVVSAVVSAGLSVELLREYDYTVFPRWPFLQKSGPGTYRSPEGSPRLPLMYSLRARKA